MVTASLKNYRQSPRKVRAVANLVKGKSAVEALSQLTFLAKRASDPLAKLIASAIANAKNNHGLDEATLYIKDFRVDGGMVLKRIMPRARGSASQILKKSSHVFLELDVLANKGKKVTTAKK